MCTPMAIVDHKSIAIEWKWNVKKNWENRLNCIETDGDLQWMEIHTYTKWMK